VFAPACCRALRASQVRGPWLPPDFAARSFLPMATKVDEKTAYHEAGHVLAAHALGLRVRHVYINKGRPSGRIQLYRLARRQKVTADACELHAIIALSGPTAENHYCGGLNNITRLWETDWRTDCAHAKDCLEGALLLKRVESGGDPFTFDVPLDELTAALDGALQQSAKLVEDNWCAIERVAAALLERSRLDAKELDVLLA
jgi:hypothetical protein